MNSRNHHMFSSVSAYLSTDVAGIRNRENLYNHWDLSIGHLRYEELEWSEFETDGGLVRFDWKWENENELVLDVVIPIGHFGHLHFKLDECVIMAIGGDRMWIVRDNNIASEDRQSFIEKYDAKIGQKGGAMIGSGHYKWRLSCV